MAMYSIRLRRAVSLSTTLINHNKLLSPLPSITSSSLSSSVTLTLQNPTLDDTCPNLPFQSRFFRSSTVSLRDRVPYNREDDKIGPDTILFEGCDYNHWLITIDFPKDPKPTPEEMVETYVQTCAKVVGSVEEAKKKIYACSTSTYNGFQVEVSEEMSEKFKGLPGVVFVLPDSYIDPVNKEYGGDKYINGTIIPRPPPVQYGGQRGRFGDGNRRFNQQNRPRDYRPQLNAPPQNYYGQTGTGERRDFMPMNNAPGGQGNYQRDRREATPSYNPNYNQREQQRDFPPADQRGYPPPQGGTYGQGEHRNYAPSQGGTYGQIENRNYAPPQGGTYGQGAGGNYGQGAGGTYGHGENQNYAAPQNGNYGQGVGGTYGQGAGGTYGQGVGGTQGQGMGSGYGQSYSGHGEDQQRFSQVEQRNNIPGEQRN